jgi:hypothetical protein
MAVAEKVDQPRIEEADAFEPVEYWNPVYPNEQIVIRPRKIDKDHDGAMDPTIQFVAGYFRATMPEQVTVLEGDPQISARIYKASSGNEENFRCDKCGWLTKSVAAMNYHMQQHG